jgi:hypothetical protein
VSSRSWVDFSCLIRRRREKVKMDLVWLVLRDRSVCVLLLVLDRRLEIVWTAQGSCSSLYIGRGGRRRLLGHFLDVDTLRAAWPVGQGTSGTVCQWSPWCLAGPSRPRVWRRSVYLHAAEKRWVVWHVWRVVPGCGWVHTSVGVVLLWDGSCLRIFYCSWRARRTGSTGRKGAERNGPFLCSVPSAHFCQCLSALCVGPKWWGFYAF